VHKFVCALENRAESTREPRCRVKENDAGGTAPDKKKARHEGRAVDA
jgi:hypothetical protein